MLTRIEIDGFKTFRRFSLDVPPFVVILGRNAGGKSNLFDALQFLRLIADESLLEAAQHARGGVVEIFHRHVDGSRADEMTFAVEVLLDRTVTDAFGDTVPVVHSRLRYEVRVQLRESVKGLRPFVSYEHARLIRRSDDRWIQRFDSKLRNSVAVHSSRPSDLPLTELSDHRPRFLIRQQKGSQGRPREIPASQTPVGLTRRSDRPQIRGLLRASVRARLIGEARCRSLVR